MLSLLAQGNTGADILAILDTLTADNVSEVADSTYLPILGQSIPTLEEIAFWYNTLCVLWLTLGHAHVRLYAYRIRQLYAVVVYIAARRYKKANYFNLQQSAFGK